MINQNINYNYDIQKLYLELLLADPVSYSRCQAIFDHTLFDKKLQPVAEFIFNYASEHNVLPTEQIIVATTSVSLSIPVGMQQEHFDWLLDQFETFTRHKSLEKAILESADLLEAGQYGPVEALIRSAVQISLQRDMGTDYFLDPRQRLLQIKQGNGQISTGWRDLDHLLFGGFNQGELNIFAAPSGGGKSLMLANLGINWALIGLNVVYITFELSEPLVSMRIDSMITGIPSRDIFKSIDDVETKVKIIGKKSGQIQIKYMPSGANINNIRSYIKEYTIRYSRHVNIVLVDYLDLMMPVNKKISAENMYIKDKYVSEELRNLAVELKCVMCTASQLNRCLDVETQVNVNGQLTAIKNVKVGDTITSNTGLKTVKHVYPILKQATFKIKTKNGKEIICSAKHQFPTDQGYKTIENGLTIGSKLQTTVISDIYKYIRILKHQGL